MAAQGDVRRHPQAAEPRREDVVPPAGRLRRGGRNCRVRGAIGIPGGVLSQPGWPNRRIRPPHRALRPHPAVVPSVPRPPVSRRSDDARDQRCEGDAGCDDRIHRRDTREQYVPHRHGRRTPLAGLAARHGAHRRRTGAVRRPVGLQLAHSRAFAGGAKARRRTRFGGA